MRIKHLSQLALFLAMAQVLGFFEQMIPVFTVVPGAKIGLANVVTLVIFCLFGTKYALVFGVFRSLLSAVLYSGIASFFYSATGALFSVLFMHMAQRFLKTAVSEIGLSVLGAAGFNIGQIFVCCVVLESIQPARYLPALLAVSAFAGLLTGALSQKINSYLQKSHEMKNGESK